MTRQTANSVAGNVVITVGQSAMAILRTVRAGDCVGGFLCNCYNVSESVPAGRPTNVEGSQVAWRYHTGSSTFCLKQPSVQSAQKTFCVNIESSLASVRPAHRPTRRVTGVFFCDGVATVSVCRLSCTSSTGIRTCTTPQTIVTGAFMPN